MSLNFRLNSKNGVRGSHSYCEKRHSSSTEIGLEAVRVGVCLAAGLIAAGYGAWLLIPMVIRSDFAPHIKTPLIAMLGATPLLTKLAAIALFGKPVVDLVKRYAVNFWQR